MRLKPQQTGYVATKIGIDLANAPFITMPKGREAVVAAAKEIIDANLAKEHAKNVIFKSFKAFADAYDEIDDIVYDKIKNMDREIIPGTQDYELMYERLYQEELAKRGML
jgi:hypothetical protein